MAPMVASIINGKERADKLCVELKAKIEILFAKHRVIPGLAVVLVGDDPSSIIYVQNKIKKAKEIGINIFDITFPSTISERILKAKLEQLNNDQRVHGVLLQLPLPSSLDKFEILDTINSDKDVDGFTTRNIGLLHSGRECLEPCTPRGAMILIKDALGNDLSGKKAVVVGRSMIVGRPMASMLLKENCSVTVLHSQSVDIEKECKEADILISAVGQPNLIKASMVKEGACVIDVGITRSEGKLHGDVMYDEVSKVAGFITPVPGGVGPMTVACMLENTVMAACKLKNILYRSLK